VLNPSATTRILVAHGDVSFRGGIDHLAAICRRAMPDDNPMSGTVFVFRNRRHTMARLLFYDGQGFVLTTKRLSAERFRYWPSATSQLAARELAVLLWAGDPRGAKFAADWRPVGPQKPPPTDGSKTAPPR
jgi:transposase